MGYLQDAPRSVGPMIKVLRAMGQYKYDPSEVFRDFVDYSVACLLVDGDKAVADRLHGQYGNDYGLLADLFQAWVLILNDEIHEDGTASWFDALGTVYEYLASQHKQSWLGQFFTPPDLCDLCTLLTSDPEKKPLGKRVNDPAAGSGRMLLSFLAHNPGNYVYGEDVDPICAKMCALNLAFHGGQGQVTCMDSLAMNDFRFGYEVNPFHRLGAPPVPHLLPITKEQCWTWQGNQRAIQEAQAKRLLRAEPLPVEPNAVPIQVQPQVSQLTLF